MSNTKTFRDQPMDDDIVSVVVDTRGNNKVSFTNVYDAGTPDGNFTYEMTNNPVVLGNADDERAGWVTITPSVTHGTQPAGSGSGPTVFGVVFVDQFRFVRQKWTRVAGDATDLCDTHIDIDKT